MKNKFIDSLLDFMCFCERHIVPFIIIILICCLMLLYTSIMSKQTEQEQVYCETINTFISETISPIPTTLNIPTYPDYIELDRDLVIEVPLEVMANETLSSYSFPKGTKIYFKGEIK